MTRMRRGFTLVELLVVVAIIGLLAAIAIPKFDVASQRARQAEAKVNLEALYLGEMTYYANNTMFSGSLALIGFQPERGNRYAYYINLPAVAMQSRSAATLSVPTGEDAIGADTFKYPEIGAQPTEFGTDGTLSFGPAPLSKYVIPSGSVTYFGTGNKGAFLARAFGKISSSIVSDDAWFISSNSATVTSPCKFANGTRVSAGTPGFTYDQSRCP